MSNSPGLPTEHDRGDYGEEEREPTKYGLNLLLFVLTTLSVFWSGAAQLDSTLADSLDPRRLLEIWRGWPFALPLMAILVAHESGHYVAARIHRVPASLPFFIPLPKFSPFGTLGAIIGMKSFGASGPAKELYKHFGITVEAVVAAAEAKL
jgi:membrane-associated protease RseP (regulator of RpoE activity)